MPTYNFVRSPLLTVITGDIFMFEQFSKV